MPVQFSVQFSSGIPDATQEVLEVEPRSLVLELILLVLYNSVS